MKQKMRVARLAARVRSFEMTMARQADFKVQARKESGGYHRPGSMKR